MKLTYPVPVREIVGYRQVPVFQTKITEETLLDYDFKAAKRAKAVGKFAFLSSVAYVLFPPVALTATLVDFIKDVGEAVYYAGRGAIEQGIVQTRRFYSGAAHPALSQVFREIID